MRKLVAINTEYNNYYLDIPNSERTMPLSYEVISKWKHSPNIIDLIEKGDYINGKKVIYVLDGFSDGTMEIELSNHRKIYRTHIEDIKSIVTKEQYSSMEYKVGD